MPKPKNEATIRIKRLPGSVDTIIDDIKQCNDVKVKTDEIDEVYSRLACMNVMVGNALKIQQKGIDDMNKRLDGIEKSCKPTKKKTG